MLLQVLHKLHGGLRCVGVAEITAREPLRDNHRRSPRKVPELPVPGFARLAILLKSIGMRCVLSKKLTKIFRKNQSSLYEDFRELV